MISYLELGGTLFIPASHQDMNHIVSGEKYPHLQSLVIDFEDGLDAKMIEPLTLSSYSQLTVQRAQIYGIVDIYEE